MTAAQVRAFLQALASRPACGAGARPAAPHGRGGRIARGFTLIELMVVVVLAGVMLAMVSISAFPDDRSKLREEADRLAQLWTIAQDEAVVRGTPVLWQATTEGYEFAVRDGRRWRALDRDTALRARPWPFTPLRVSVLGLTANGPQTSQIRIEFSRATLAEPIVATLQYGGATATVRGDGLGGFSVDEVPR
ncbi:type II secretion system minor pseudopilin GspH [Derxia gummosa]|uniref:Type II secretion system protein H n=1 Tax=Derxia gummosa DSM 723 TaxID=1121388 RepID=A0A8B6X9L1_9BURK|nr:type II secretion system minor pseudopilin GspH [Derxia gummosa]